MSVLRPICAFSLLAAMASPAYAYLDGATASFVLQGVIGVFAAWGLYSRRALGAVKRVFSRSQPPQP